MRKSRAILIPSLIHRTYRKTTNGCVHVKKSMHEGPRFLLLWNWTWLSVVTLRGHQPGRPAKQSNQSSLAQDSNPESTKPLGNCSDLKESGTGEDKGPCGRRDRCIFPKCIARSSPGKDFSFIFIGLQNKQG